MLMCSDCSLKSDNGIAAVVAQQAIINTLTPLRRAASNIVVNTLRRDVPLLYCVFQQALALFVVAFGPGLASPAFAVIPCWQKVGIEHGH